MSSERTFSRSQHNKKLSSSLLVPSFLRPMLKLKRPLYCSVGRVWEAGGGQVGTGPGGSGAVSRAEDGHGQGVAANPGPDTVT